MMILLLLAQAATLPDIQLHAEVRAKSVTIEQKGETSLTVHADPIAAQDVSVVAPRDGATSLKDVRVTVDAQVTIADPAAPASTPTPAPKPTQ